MGLAELVTISRTYGGDPAWVLAGGGNTSYKDAEWLWIKASGTTLATIDEGGFVPMSRAALQAIWSHRYPDDTAERESAALADLMAARKDTDGPRPSVETLMHELLPQTYVVHTHPALVNGMTCGRNGKEIAMRLFDVDAIWIDQIEPGYILAREIRDSLRRFREESRRDCSLIFLENHGVVVAGNTTGEIREQQDRVMALCSKQVEETLGIGASSPPVVTPAPVSERAARAQTALAELFSDHFVTHATSTAMAPLLASLAAAEPILGVYTPDHLVYAGQMPCFIACSAEEDPAQRIREHFETVPDTTPPKSILLQSVAAYGVGRARSSAHASCSLILDSAAVALYSGAFGGHRFMEPRLVQFIANWEVEQYRARTGQGES